MTRCAALLISGSKVRVLDGPPDESATSGASGVADPVFASSATYSDARSARYGRVVTLTRSATRWLLNWHTKGAIVGRSAGERGFVYCVEVVNYIHFLKPRLGGEHPIFLYAAPDVNLDQRILLVELVDC